MKTVLIGEISDQIRGVSYAKQDAIDSPRDGYLPILRANNITDEGLNFDDLVYVPSAKIAGKQRLRKHDVVVAASSGSLSVVGKTAQAESDFVGAFGAFCKVLRPVPNVDPRYFGHFFRTPRYRRTISSLAAGANINNLKNEHLDGLEIPLPPLSEQKRIAAILDAADALRAKRRESIAQLDTLLQATFLDMFGDPVTNPMGWETMPFSHIGEFVSGGTPSKACSEYWGGNIPWVSPKDMKVSEISRTEDYVTETALEQTSLKLLPPGHLLIVVRGMILAHSFPVALNSVAVSINQDMKAIHLSPSFSLLFLLHCVQNMKRSVLANVSTAGHGTRRLDRESMRKILVPVPALALQEKFAVAAKCVQQQQVVARSYLDEGNRLFASLQSRAFSGQL